MLKSILLFNIAVIVDARLLPFLTVAPAAATV
jgi:hypothetical protein